MNQSYAEVENKKPKVLMYYTYADKIGGPLTYINTLINSKLKDDFEFKTLFQGKAPGGLDIVLMKDMIAKIKAEKPDILHVHGVQSEGLYGVLAGKIAGCKNVVMTVHGFAFDDSVYHGIKKFLYKFIVEPLTVRLADKVYCVCEFASKRFIVRKNAKKSGNFGYIHNPAPELIRKETRENVRKRLSVSDEDIVFCISARLSKEKGFDILGEIVRQAKIKTNNKFKFLVLGDGAYKDEFVCDVNEEIENGTVIMTGSTDRVADYLAASDAFIFPSYHENLSIAILEACLSELPCIVSNVGGNPEIIENDINGFVINSFEPDDYVEKIVFLTENPEIRKEMGRKNKEIISEKFSLDHICDQVKKVYLG